MEGTNETPPIEAAQEENPTPATTAVVDSPMEVFEDTEDGGSTLEPAVPAESSTQVGEAENDENSRADAVPEQSEAVTPESHNDETDKKDESSLKESKNIQDENALKEESENKKDENEVESKHDETPEHQTKQEVAEGNEDSNDGVEIVDAVPHNETDFLQDVEMHDIDDKFKHEAEPMEEMDIDHDEEKSVDKTVSDDPFDQIKHATNDNGHDEVDRPPSRPSNEHLDEESNDHDDEQQHDATHDDTLAMDEEDAQKDKEGEDEEDEPNTSRRTIQEEDDEHNANDEGHDDSTALDETGPHDDSAVQDESVAEDGVDEITEGEGVDEDVCLLPDDEREISDADKEAAIAAREAETAEQEKVPEKETESSEAAPVEPTSSLETPAESSEQDTTVDLTEQEKETETHEEPDQDHEHEHEHEEPEAPEVEAPPKANEIRELSDKTEGKCSKCSESKMCQYSLVDEVDTEAKYVCSFDCVQSLRNENAEKYTLIQKKVSIYPIFDIEATCDKCQDKKACKFRYKTNAGYIYLCSNKCVEYNTSTNAEKYSLKKKRYVIDEILASEQKDATCVQCTETKTCGYHFKQDDDEELFICNDDCLNLLMTEQSDLFRLKRRSVRVRNLPKSFPDEVLEATDNKVVARSEEEAESARLDREASFIRRCTQCFSVIAITEKTLQWETFDFCNEKCLGVYQNTIGAHCATCSCSVSVTSLGKYCVRFGFEVKQFCRSSCLDSYKKSLKVCSFCQRDIAHGKLGFLAPIGDKKVFKDFCTKECLKKYEEVLTPKKKHVLKTCAVCNNEKFAKIDIVLDGRDHHFCSTPCFSAFKFVNNVTPDQCAMCQSYFERKSSDPHTIYATDKAPDASCFCTKICMNLYIITNRKIVSCNWCKVKKYNFDMIHKVASNMSLCSLNCLTLCEVSVNALSQKQVCCDHCKLTKTPQYHLTMSDASVRNFCTYQCVMSFQSQFNKTPLTIDNEDVGNSPVPTGLPKRVKKALPQPVAPAPPQHTAKPNKRISTRKQAPPPVPVIASVQSLATRSSSRSKGSTPGKSKQLDLQDVRVTLEPINLPSSGRISLREQRETRETRELRESRELRETRESRESRETRESARSHHREPREYREIAAAPPPPPPKVEVRTQVVSVPELPKAVANASTMCKPIQQSKGVSCKPMQMDAECQTDAYLQRKIVIPIPVPIYIPTPMHMYSLPTPIPVPIPLPIPVPVFIPTTRNSANGIMKEIKKIQDKMPTDPYEAELLMMAEMVAGEKKKDDTDSDSGDDNEDNYIENNVPFNEDLVQMALKMASNDFDEPAVDLESAMTANTIHPQQQPHHHMIGDDQAMHHHQLLLLEQQRQAQQQMSNRGRKRGSTNRPTNNNNRAIQSPNKRIKREQLPEPSPEPPREPTEKPDANMCLKYTFGVNAWKQWVLTKNADLEKSTLRRKPFKSEILQMTADELNYSLCLFVKEVRKPNGTEYAPDTIYYLVLGIQQYLFENGRIDNIFTDPYYERFTDCLDEVAKKFSVLYNDSQYIVTRVEEEHLWECKQLGAHSPHVLLSTLMFFNTKHFNLTTVEEHMELSFSHIMKHWKRNPGNQAGAAKTPGSRNVLLRFYPPQSSLAANSRKKKVYEQQENEENPLRCPVKLYEFYLSKCPESVKTRNDVFYLQPERSCVPDSPVWYSTQPLSQQALCKMLHRVKMVKEINIALLTS